MPNSLGILQHQGELKRRITGCRERLRRNRTTPKITTRATIFANPAHVETSELCNAYKRDAQEGNEMPAAIIVTSNSSFEKEVTDDLIRPRYHESGAKEEMEEE